MATATFSPNDLLVSDWPVAVRYITLLSGQNLKRGAVIGNITASDKYTLSLTASADGSQTPDLVLAIDGDASAGDLVVAAYASAAFDSTKLIYGTGHTAASVEAAFRKKSAPLFVRTLK